MTKTDAEKFPNSTEKPTPIEADLVPAEPIQAVDEKSDPLTSLDKSGSVDAVSLLDLRVTTDPLGLLLLFGVDDEVAELPIKMDKKTALGVGNALRKAAKLRRK